MIAVSQLLLPISFFYSHPLAILQLPAMPRAPPPPPPPPPVDLPSALGSPRSTRQWRSCCRGFGRNQSTLSTSSPRPRSSFPFPSEEIMTKLIIKIMIKLMNRQKLMNRNINTVHRLPVREWVRVRVCASVLHLLIPARQLIRTQPHTISHTHTCTHTHNQS